MARATTPRGGGSQRRAPQTQNNDERALRLLREAIALLEADQLGTARRANAEDDDSTRRPGSHKPRR